MQNAARIDMFGPIHKAIRCALAHVLTELGTTSFANAAAATHVADLVDEVLDLCEDHRGHEDRILLPAVMERVQGATDRVHGAHAAQGVVVAELRAGAVAVRTTTRDDQRMISGRTLYLHFSTFAAELLLHMAEEEQVLAPVLERQFSDTELRAIHGRLLGALSMEEKLRATPWMMRGMSAVERNMMLQASMGGGAR